jgi:hypothetical protein
MDFDSFTEEKKSTGIPNTETSEILIQLPFGSKQKPEQ